MSSHKLSQYLFACIPSFPNRYFCCSSSALHKLGLAFKVALFSKEFANFCDKGSVSRWFSLSEIHFFFSWSSLIVYTLTCCNCHSDAISVSQVLLHSKSIIWHFGFKHGRILNPVEHLQESFFAKLVNSF